MRYSRLAMMVGLALTLLLPPVIATAEPVVDQEIKSGYRDEEHCFSRSLVFGNIVIPGQRCYSFYVFRDNRGHFLGFGPQGPRMIPPGQLVRMNTPAGAKVKGRLFYLVPLPVRSSTSMALDSIQSVRVRVSETPGGLIITLPGGLFGVGDRSIELPFRLR